MEDLDALRGRLLQMDGRGYPSYKDLRGESFALGSGMTLFLDHVQGDPFAAPSRIRVRVSAGEAGFPEWCVRSDSRRIAMESYLARAFAAACHSRQGRSGSGKSGWIGIDEPGQEVLEQSAVRWLGDAVEARFVVGLPARGRRILGRAAAELLCEEVPKLADDALRFASLNEPRLKREVESCEDADALRAQLGERGLVGFVANGSILPRASGRDPRPLSRKEAVPFASPASLEITLEVPNAGTVTGMGIPEGVTLIVGGGFHGKSTLLNALERGVYNHQDGDGREAVVAHRDTVKIRAEDGRSVASVDISPFINNLPDGSDTRNFSTTNASGSTSQAANIAEAIESGARVLLIDEDIAATNFMIRDQRMRELVAAGKEPITPFVSKVRALYEELGISSILVIGGSGDYFGVADHVISMDRYRPHDVTGAAHEIAGRYRGSVPESLGGFSGPAGRVVDPRSLDPSRGKRDASIKTRDLHTIEFGEDRIELDAVAQLVHPAQTRALGAALLHAWSKGLFEKGWPLPEVLDALEALPLDEVAEPAAGPRGDLARFRRHELAAGLNRLRPLRIQVG